ncbi:hypothetical protein N0V90_003626 [Kalmusia sp. IMI 367209]|nr:hypothetical protein N0V90_003626 [Kalmusia sp. IMI 367209]
MDDERKGSLLTIPAPPLEPYSSTPQQASPFHLATSVVREHSLSLPRRAPAPTPLPRWHVPTAVAIPPREDIRKLLVLGPPAPLPSLGEEVQHLAASIEREERHEVDMPDVNVMRTLMPTPHLRSRYDNTVLRRVERISMNKVVVGLRSELRSWGRGGFRGLDGKGKGIDDEGSERVEEKKRMVEMLGGREIEQSGKNVETNVKQRDSSEGVQVASSEPVLDQEELDKADDESTSTHIIAPLLALGHHPPTPLAPSTSGNHDIPNRLTSTPSYLHPGIGCDVNLFPRLSDSPLNRAPKELRHDSKPSSRIQISLLTSHQHALTESIAYPSPAYQHESTFTRPLLSPNPSTPTPSDHLSMSMFPLHPTVLNPLGQHPILTTPDKEFYALPEYTGDTPTPGPPVPPLERVPILSSVSPEGGYMDGRTGGFAGVPGARSGRVWWKDKMKGRLGESPSRLGMPLHGEEAVKVRMDEVCRPRASSEYVHGESGRLNAVPKAKEGVSGRLRAWLGKKGNGRGMRGCLARRGSAGCLCFSR